MRVANTLSLTVLLCFLCDFVHGLYLSSNDRRYALYLIKFGYLRRSSLRSSNGNSYVNDDTFRNALINFQNYVRIGASGMLDDTTKNMMEKDRCQTKDTAMGRRRRRYVVNGNWSKKHLTYKIVKYSSSVSQSEVDSIIFLAFSVWSDSAGVTFTKKDKGRTDIEIRFDEIAPRLDSHIFGNTLNAKTTIITLNDAIPWSQDFTSGVPNLFQTAAHEIGHVLGLGHTDVVGAMMFPVYDLSVKIFSLHEDDMRGVQDIYSKVDTVSYPGRYIYKKNTNKLNNNFDNFKTQITNSFGNIPDFGNLDIPKDFFENGF
ncbi:unnamed protein product [Leptosia nina]|uniref:Peptidase metallopeptidase domain-containing protein n=1 Tax=Leptosia nina TaxID=320188 RepID=A0AAV1JJF3_9NEOP